MAFSSEFDVLWKPFTSIFQAICVSNYSVFRPDLRENRFKSTMWLAYFISFSSIHLSIVYSATKNILSEMPDNSQMKHRESQLMFYVNIMTMIGGFFTHITSHLEPLFNGKREQMIYVKLKQIDHIFTTKLNYKTDHRARHTKYFRQTVMVFLLSTLLAALSSFTSMPDLYQEKYFMQPIFIFPAFIARSRWCYIAVIMNNIADNLFVLQSLLKEQQKQSVDGNQNHQARGRIQCVREIYSQLWTITTLVSGCFGLSLICLLFEFMLEAVLAAYWLYINYKFYGSSDLNNRKNIFEYFQSLQLQFQSFS